jgi:hypothetical protein
MRQSLVRGVYDEAVDRESAYEILQRRAEEAAAVAKEEAAAPAPRREPASGRRRQTAAEAFISSAVRSIGSQIGRALARGILGSLTGGRRR